MTKKMPLRWLSSSTGDKQKLEKELSHYLASWPFERLREILNQEKEELTRQSDYDNPSWAYRQAHINGRLEQITNVLNLIGKE